MAGYSTRTLVEKLGIKDSYVITFINNPSEYEKTLGPLPPHVMIALLEEGVFDFIQYFATDTEEFEHIFPILKKHLKPTGMLWISWTKKTAQTKTDLNETIIREVGLKNGLVDVKVIAVDDVWSGLKFVYRLVDRS